MTQRELEGWRRALESRRDWCASIGAEFLFVVAPNKTEVYPELVPAQFDRVGPTRLDQLFEHMRARSTVAMLDLRDAMKAEKAHDSGGNFVYYPLGTHWTDRGVYAGYVAILEVLRKRFPRLVPIPRDQIAWTEAGHQGDSWAGRMYMSGLLVQENLIGTLPESPTATVAQEGPGGNTSLVTVHRNQELPSAVVFHDSFGEPLRKFLVPHFSKALFIWQDGFDTARIAAADPDLVLQVYVERKLNGNPPPLATSGDASASRAAFEASQRVLLRIDPAQDLDEFELVGKTKLQRVDGGFEIVITQGSDWLFLPPFGVGADENPVLHLDVESPFPTWIDVIFKVRGDADYKRKNSYRIDLVAGRNDVYLEMFTPDLEGRLFVRPEASQGGRFVVRALEVRAVKP
jgi:hypothetical protein